MTNHGGGCQPSATGWQTGLKANLIRLRCSWAQNQIQQWRHCSERVVLWRTTGRNKGAALQELDRGQQRSDRTDGGIIRTSVEIADHVASHRSQRPPWLYWESDPSQVSGLLLNTSVLNLQCLQEVCWRGCWGPWASTAGIWKSSQISVDPFHSVTNYKGPEVV